MSVEEACWIGVRCAGCTRIAFVPLRLISAKRGGRALLREVLERLRCEHCKMSPATAWLTDYPIESAGHGGQVASWRVDLLP